MESGEAPIEALRQQVNQKTVFAIERTVLVGVYARQNVSTPESK